MAGPTDMVVKYATKKAGEKTKEKAGDVVEKVKDAVTSGSKKDAKGKDSQGPNLKAVKKAHKEGKLTYNKKDLMLYDVVLPSIAAIARFFGMSVGSFITAIAGAQAAKASLTPDSKKAKYGTTQFDATAAISAPVAAAVGGIAGNAGKEVAGVIDRAANQAKITRNREIFANRDDLGLPNSSGMMMYLNGAEHRAQADLEKDKPAEPQEYNTSHIYNSDERLKEIDFETAIDLCKGAGKFGDKDIFNDDEEYDDSVLDGYADHIFNYKYKYKDKAKEIDPSIDTEQEHIGPMAQEVEQVNPACVVEKDGYKAVDTGRLALMNAGAIGDLARKVGALEEKVNG